MEVPKHLLSGALLIAALCLCVHTTWHPVARQSQYAEVVGAKPHVIPKYHLKSSIVRHLGSDVVSANVNVIGMQPRRSPVSQKVTSGAPRWALPGLEPLLGAVFGALAGLVFSLVYRKPQQWATLSSSGAVEPLPVAGKQYSVTSLESNSFALDLDGTKLLIDPWLTGTLTFADAQWLYEGKKRQIAQLPFTPEQVPDLFDAIVLTQGLDDHAHLPTLRRIPKTMRILANPQAAEVCQGLGFTNVETVRAGSFGIVKNVEVRAFPGSLVGPPWSERQNGYCFRVGDFRVVTEPHGNIPDLGYECDVLIMPVISQILGGYPLVNGIPEALSAAQQLKPKLFIPLENGEIDSDGVLAQLLKEDGSIPAFQKAVEALRLPTQVLRMEPYKAIPIQPEGVAINSFISQKLQTVAMDQIFLDALGPIQTFANKAKIGGLKQRLAKLVQPLNYGADMTPEQADEVLQLVEEFKAVNPIPAPVASPDINARWKLLWTTEKEQLFFVKNGFFGSQFTAAKQDIDTNTGRLQNLIEFENGDYFSVSSTLQPAPPIRCNFKFQGCQCRRGPVSVPLPPVGQGWFDTIFLDDTLRIAQDIRGDTLIVVRDTSEERFTLPVRN